MKKVFFINLLLLYVFAMQAQEQIRVWKEGNSKRFSTSGIEFSEDGTSFSVADSTYDCATIDSITVVHTVTVTFAGDTAYVDLGHAANVTTTVEGAHVNLLSTNTKSELEFVLQGESTHGSLTYDGPLKCKFYLNGLNLTSNKGAAIDIKCGKRVDLILKDGTENVLVDAAGGEQKAAFYCKGHLEIKGHGTLNVKGMTKHALAAKEYLEIKRSTGTINILGAVSDGIHCGKGGNAKVEQDYDPEDNYFIMNGSDTTYINISNCGGDCIDSDDYGSMKINGGVITMNISQIDGNGLKCDSIIYMDGGKIVANITGQVSNGVRSAYDMYLRGGTIECNITGNGSKGIRGRRLTAAAYTVLRGGNIHFEGTNVKMTVAGGTYTTDSSNCQGIRAEYYLYQTGGDIDITVTNSEASAIYAKSDKWDGVSGTRTIH
jgi:hypothetical protein